MKLGPLSLAVLLAVGLAGCGGGGTGGSDTSIEVSGTVVWLGTGGAPQPPATVQIGDRSVQTEPLSGAFSLPTRPGPVSLLVVYEPPSGSMVSFRFELGELARSTDVGVLPIGRERVTARGRVVDAGTSQPVAGARVRFAGREAATSADGSFVLVEVAYDPDGLNAFFGLEGTVDASGYLPLTFTPSSPAVRGTVDLGDLALSRPGEDTPPPVPANLFGRILPPERAEGTVVELSSGESVIRRFTVGSDRRYGFFVPAGTYRLRAFHPRFGLSAPEEIVTLESPDQVIARDLTLR